MKKYALKENVYEVMRWTGNNVKEFREFVNIRDGQEVFINSEDELELIRGTEHRIIELGEYVCRDIEYGLISVWDKRIFDNRAFVCEVDVKELQYVATKRTRLDNSIYDHVYKIEDKPLQCWNKEEKE